MHMSYCHIRYFSVYTYFLSELAYMLMISVIIGKILDSSHREDDEEKQLDHIFY